MVDTDDARSPTATETRLLNALLADGRASLEDLSEELDVPLVTVADALERLEAEGYVEGYRPELDYAAVGFDVTAIVRLSVRRSALDDIVRELRDDPRLISVYEVAGECELVAIGTFADRSSLDERTGQLLADPAVRSGSVAIAEAVVCEYRQFPLPVDEE